MMQKLWDILTTITKMEFTAKCRQIPPSFETRKGQGQVVLENQEKNTIVLFEKGNWKGVQSETQIAFTNIFRWRLEEKKIALEHLRFGKNRPVFLFDLVPVGSNLFQSIKPHECKEDTYYGKLLFDTHFVHLQWRITGPHKNEVIDTHYY